MTVVIISSGGVTQVKEFVGIIAIARIARVAKSRLIASGRATRASLSTATAEAKSRATGGMTRAIERTVTVAIISCGGVTQFKEFVGIIAIARIARAAKSRSTASGGATRASVSTATAEAKSRATGGTMRAIERTVTVANLAAE
jgi:hypothetical protein